MALINIENLIEKALKAGFKVNRLWVIGGEASTMQIEISEPTHDDGGIRSPGGEVYSTAQFTIGDGPDGYGYNGFFRGPWHHGYAQDSAYGVQELLKHPMMGGGT